VLFTTWLYAHSLLCTHSKAVAKITGCSAGGVGFGLTVWQKTGTDVTMEADENHAPELKSYATTQHFVDDNFGLAFSELLSQRKRKRPSRH
jgi:hypothetical protein